MGERSIPTDENGRMLINYLGPQGTFPHYPISHILHHKLPKGTFRGKLVLLGATAIAIYDVRNTPFSALFPGLEVHATVIDNILKGNILNKPTWTYDVLAILILGLLTGLVVRRLGALKGIFFSSVLFILYIWISRWLFIRWGIWVNIVYPLLVLVISILALPHIVI